MGRGPAAAAQRSPTLTRHAANGVKSAWHGVNNFFARRYGLDGKERLAIAGAMVAAPVAAIAAPLVGFGVAGAMVAPHLMRRSKQMRQAERLKEAEQMLVASGRVVPTADAEQMLQQMAASQQQIAPGAAVEPATPTEAQARGELQEMAQLVVGLQHQVKDLEGMVKMQAIALREQKGARLVPHAFTKKSAKKGSAKKAAGKKQLHQASGADLSAVLTPPSAMDEASYLAWRNEQRQTQAPAAILPLEPHWAEHVLGGTSGGYEFRKGIKDKLVPGSRNYIYTKSPVGAVTGYCDVEEVISGPAEEVWEQIKDRPEFGYTESDFFGHVGADGDVQVFRYGNIQRFERPLHYKDDLGMKPTQLQGVRYVDPDAIPQHTKLVEAAERQDFKVLSANGGAYKIDASGSKAPDEVAAAAEKEKARYEKKIGRRCSAMELSGAAAAA